MSWFNSNMYWAKNIKLPNGTSVSRSSGVKASSKTVRWKDEKPSIKTKAENTLNIRIAKEGLVVEQKRNHTFSEVCEMYKKHYPRGHQEYRLNKLEDEFGNMHINKIAVLDIRRYHNKILENCKTSTWNRYRSDLSSIFNRAIEWGLCSSNPAKAVKAYPESLTEEYLSQEHADAILKESKKHSFYMYAIVYIALHCGKRVSEITDMAWDDVNPSQETIKFRVKKKKGGAYEQVQRPPLSVFTVLEELKHINPEKPFPYFPRRAWRKVRDKVDLEIGLPDRRFHALRHRCATRIFAD